jgi:hypothetical protein
VLELLNEKTFRHQSPQLYEAVVDGLAFVNWRRLETGDPAKINERSRHDLEDSKTGRRGTLLHLKIQRHGVAGFHRLVFHIDREAMLSLVQMKVSGIDGR